ncbi:hypothetical protein CC2G_001903 [Coprinopsis cinerea AmutBmut pab1-1]|nr:hypothetical protein CC2G_001903 [Coprinopsis cinerea AmutBmut pab1-1]
MTDHPILVWILSLNRDYSVTEYDQCHKVVQECIQHTSFPYQPKNPDSFRKIVTTLLPLLMMRHRRIPRAKWKDYTNNQGKHWIEQSPDGLPPEKYPYSMIGYHLTFSNSVCGMAMTQGERSKVVNIGFGVNQYAVPSQGTSVETYVESMSHKLKLTALELQSLQGQSKEVALRRLCILLALKDSYIRALGQPLGFDYARLEFDVANHKAWGDGKPLTGWEFRIFTASLGVARGSQLVSELYECACAFFRGTNEIKFVWHQTARELEGWVQFINLDQMVKVLPKLSA